MSPDHRLQEPGALCQPAPTGRRGEAELDFPQGTGQASGSGGDAAEGPRGASGWGLEPLGGFWGAGLVRRPRLASWHMQQPLPTQSVPEAPCAASWPSSSRLSPHRGHSQLYPSSSASLQASFSPQRPRGRAGRRVGSRKSRVTLGAPPAGLTWAGRRRLPWGALGVSCCLQEHCGPRQHMMISASGGRAGGPPSTPLSATAGPAAFQPELNSEREPAGPTTASAHQSLTRATRPCCVACEREDS